VAGPDHIRDEIIGRKKPEDRILIAQRSPPYRLRPKEDHRENKQQTQAEDISLGLTVRNGRSPVQTGNLSDLSRT
jgi:hypothetical protein